MCAHHRSLAFAPFLVPSFFSRRPSGVRPPLSLTRTHPRAQAPFCARTTHALVRARARARVWCVWPRALCPAPHVRPPLCSGPSPYTYRRGGLIGASPLSQSLRLSAFPLFSNSRLVRAHARAPPFSSPSLRPLCLSLTSKERAVCHPLHVHLLFFPLLARLLNNHQGDHLLCRTQTQQHTKCRTHPFKVRTQTAPHNARATLPPPPSC